MADEDIDKVIDEDMLKAVVDMIGRTGATAFQIRYQDDEEPVVWVAVGEWKREGRSVYEVGASVEPIKAAIRLLERVGDGGKCQHCGRPTGVTEQIGQMFLDTHVCWYQYDPELKTFRRGCEGETS